MKNAKGPKVNGMKEEKEFKKKKIQ